MKPGGPEHRQVLASYARQSWLVRLYVRFRSRYYPLDTYLTHLPTRGKIVDLGCGYGVLIMLLARMRPEADFLGLDSDDHRIKIASQSAAGVGRVMFATGGWEQISEHRADAILLVDVLHHIPRDRQAAVLRVAAASLNPGGALLINETNPSTPQRWRYWWNYLSDVLLYPTRPRCFFRTPKEMRELAADVGLALEAEPLPGAFGFSTILYVCRRPST